MLPYQKQVIQERAELKERAASLSSFIGTSLVFEEVPPAEQELLKEQCEIMWEYYEVLTNRIKLFNSINSTKG